MPSDTWTISPNTAKTWLLRHPPHHPPPAYLGNCRVSAPDAVIPAGPTPSAVKKNPTAGILVKVLVGITIFAVCGAYWLTGGPSSLIGGGSAMPGGSAFGRLGSPKPFLQA